jgi:predicted HD superfamily hydrolase involved in NAD metabolism
MREPRRPLDPLLWDAQHQPFVREPERDSSIQPIPRVEIARGERTFSESRQVKSELAEGEWVDRYSAKRTQIIEWLSGNVPEKRLSHILRVEEMAIQLAQCHGLNQRQAAQAGLMHDLAKYFKPQRLLHMAEAEGVTIDPVDQMNPHLLHAQVGAIVARDDFGICDTEVLAAIRDHTLGSPGMSLLSCVIFLADSLEPGRGQTLELEQLRQSAQHNLHRAVWQTSDYTLKHLLDSAQLIHPRAVLTRNWALRVATQKVYRNQ